MLRLDGIVFTLINLLILYAALRHFLIGPIQSVLEQRKQMIDGQFASAAGKEEQAMQLKGQYEGLLADAKGESRRILEDSRQRAQREYESRVMEAEKAGHIVDKARKDVELEKQRALDGMQKQVAQVAMAAAEKILSENAGSVANRSIYDSYIAGAGEAHEADSN